MTPKDQFENTNFDTLLLQKTSNNHQRRKYVRELINSSLLTYLYIDLKYSAKQISDYIQSICPLITTCPGVIIGWLQDTGIRTRSYSESTQTGDVKSRRIKTLLRNCGYDENTNVSNISQIPEVKIKKEKKCLLHYGVTNNFKSTEIKAKIRKYWLDNFGVTHPCHLRLPHQKFYISKPHGLLIDILKNLNIEHEVEVNTYFYGINPITQKYFRPRADIYIPKYKLVIEVFGDYWHANPKYYKHTDEFNTVYGRLTAKQIWDRDNIKIEHYKSLGYNIEVVWVTDISIENIKTLISKYENTINN